MTASNPDRWAAPNYTRFTGSDASSLQQTFQSLSNYLEKINNSVTIASGAGVLSLTGTANNIVVSASTGNVTLSLSPNIVVNSTIMNRANATSWSSGGNIEFQIDGSSRAFIGSNGAQYGDVAITGAYRGGYTGLNFGGSSALGTPHLMFNSSNNGGQYHYGYWATFWNNTNLCLGIGAESTTAGYSCQVNGSLRVTGSVVTSGYGAFGGTGLTEGVSTPSWFRSTGNSGWYSQTHGGGWWMYDAWIRSYNEKNVYMSQEVRIGTIFTGNVGRSRGSYGGISFGSNGITNAWDGIEFAAPTTQTFMVQNDNYSGMYRANAAWNWLWSYNTLQVGSDVRFKRNITPLNIGLNFLKQLEPIAYQKLTESCDDDPEQCEEGYYYGFSAQNVRAALDACGETRDVKIHDIGGPNMGLVACTEDAVYDRQYLGVTEFMGPVVLAIKELEQRLSQLEGTV